MKISKNLKAHISAFTYILVIAGCTKHEAVFEQPTSVQQVSSDPLAQGNSPAVFVDQSPLLIDSLRVAIYSEEFASRFGLELSGAANQLPPDLYAIRFSVERMVHVSPDIYSCNFEVYVNAGLSLRSPEELPISNRGAIDAHHFFANDFDGWRREDIQRFTQRFSEYNMKAFLSSPPAVTEGVRESLFTVEHYEQLFEGIDYIKLRGCMIFAEKIADEKLDLQLWLELVGGSDYAVEQNIDPEHFIKFDLPISFVNEFSLMMKQVTEKTDQLMALDMEAN